MGQSNQLPYKNLSSPCWAVSTTSSVAHYGFEGDLLAGPLTLLLDQLGKAIKKYNRTRKFGDLQKSQDESLTNIKQLPNLIRICSGFNY